MTHVWALLLDRPLSGTEELELMAMLPSLRRERLCRVRLPEKRQEALCAYMILRRALREQYRWEEIPPMDWDVRQKPFFPDFPQVQFNLSHTRGAVLAAVSNQPVGADIEQIRPLSSLARRRLAGAVDEGTFFQSWVRREAIGKWQGTGVWPHEQEPVCPPESRFIVLDTFPGYAAGVCVCAGAVPVELHRERLTQIL